MTTRLQDLAFSTVLTTVTCCRCAVMFAIPQDLQRRLVQNHEIFYCPFGHGQSYDGETDARRIEKLEKRIREERENTEYWRLQEKTRRHQISAQKGQVTKIKNRIARGVCPCCNRSFPQMAAHIKTQHPDFTMPKEAQE